MAMMAENANNSDDDSHTNGSMYEDEADPIADYRQSLADLVFNSKPHILMLTMLAEDYKDTKAAEIVDCIEQRLFQVSTDKKLPTLYLIDSICKNLTDSSYVELFQAKLIKMFCHTFERSDEKIKVLLYKLRQTWNDIFASNVLYTLDVNVKKIDKGWPITIKPSSSENGHKNVSVKSSNADSKAISSKPNTKAAEITAQLLLKQNESLALHRQQIEMDLRNKIIMNAQKSGQLPLDHCEPIMSTTTTSPAASQPASHRKPQQQKSPKESKRKNSISSVHDLPPIKKGKKESNNSNNNSNKVNNNKNKNQLKKSAPTLLPPISSSLLKKNNNNNNKKSIGINKRKAPPPVHNPPKTSKKSILDPLPLNLPIAPDDVIPLGNDHRTAGPKWSKQDVRFHRSEHSSGAISNSVKSRRSPFRHRSPSQSAPQSSSSSTRNRSSPTKLFKNDSSSVSNPINNNKKMSTSATIQTTIPEPNIFAQSGVLYSFASLDNVGPKSSDPSWNQSSSAPPASFGMDRDYRNEFDTLVSEAKNKLNTGAITSADHEVLVREAERHLYEMQNNAPNPFNANSPFATAGAPNHQSLPSVPLPTTSAPSQPPQAGPCLLEPNGSIVLFINNELRRLYYVDNVTSIVLLKVHPDTSFSQLVPCDPTLLEPKQVFFSGMTTTVFIDHGQPTEQSINLEFNTGMPVTFYFPGISVPQQIMLGLPARELVINGRHHQAAFGGPSISLYFDCDNKYHTFQLSDSRPLLKFSDDYRCDLWLKLVNDARLKAGLPAMSQPQQPHYNYPASTVPMPSVTHPYSNSINNNSNSYLVPQPSQQHLPPPHSIPVYNQPPFDVAQQSVQVQPSTNLSYNIPTTSSFDNSNSATSSTTNKFPDLNSLLSKLTAVGLIGNKANTTTTTTTATTSSSQVDSDSKKKEEPVVVVVPKQYLPLEVSALKNSHQFVVDQLYSGVQCTNCSLRFSDAASKDGKGTKSRYSRHLDWHFRQNRRDKAKPGSNSGSSTVAHRRPWYYPIDLWTLFKEVNDDIEEDSSEFFDSSSANSPGGTSTTVDNFDFSRFKESISDFDTFIEVISCDNNGLLAAAAARNNNNGGGQLKKVCSVVAESDAKLNSCTVCNEPFDLKWHEEEEEWRLPNAVRYSVNEEDTPTSRIFHPLCLKDYIMQQEKSIMADGSQMSIDGVNTTADSSAVDSDLKNVKKEETDDNNSSPRKTTNDSKKENFVIPGFDSYIKEEEVETDEKPDTNKMDDDILNALKLEMMEQDEGDLNSDQAHSADESIVDEQPPEDLEIKVFEIEIPIDGSSSTGLVIKNENESTLDDSGLSPVGHSNADAPSVPSEQQQQSLTNKPKQPIQPKRGGIVIKMKKPHAQQQPPVSTTESTTPSPPPVNQSATESGNVLDDVMTTTTATAASNECDDNDDANNNNDDDADIEMMMQLNDEDNNVDVNADHVDHNRQQQQQPKGNVVASNANTELVTLTTTTTSQSSPLQTVVDNECDVECNVDDDTDTDNSNNNKGNNNLNPDDNADDLNDANNGGDNKDDIYDRSMDTPTTAADSGGCGGGDDNDGDDGIENMNKNTDCSVIVDVRNEKQSLKQTEDKDDLTVLGGVAVATPTDEDQTSLLPPSGSDKDTTTTAVNGSGVGSLSDHSDDDPDNNDGGIKATSSIQSDGGDDHRKTSSPSLAPKSQITTSTDSDLKQDDDDDVPATSGSHQSSQETPDSNYYSRGREMSSLCRIM